MWFDRLSRKELRTLPDSVEEFRYIWQGKKEECLNGHSDIQPGSLLVSAGSERCLLHSGNHHFLHAEPPSEDESLFFSTLQTLGPKLIKGEELISPLLPASVINNECQLYPIEEYLQQVLMKGHLHHVSQHPRIDIRYIEEVTDVARAKRLAKGALTHLGSHSECWQRQTLSGIVPTKVKARFSEDELNTYENRVYAALLHELDIHLKQRTEIIRQLSNTLDKALEFYSNSVYHGLSHKICRLWGETFDEEATLETQELLESTLSSIQSMHRKIRSLKQHKLYLQIRERHLDGQALHRTNILNHDHHYRHLPILWDKLNKYRQAKKMPPDKVYIKQLELAEYYSRYAGLVLQHALQPYLPEPQTLFSDHLSLSWAGRELVLQRKDLDWKLSIKQAGSGSGSECLFYVTPFIGKGESHVKAEQSYTPDEVVIASPFFDCLPADKALISAQTIALSPFDLYSVERFGWLIDQKLNRILNQGYAQEICKIPTPVLQWISRQEIAKDILHYSTDNMSFKLLNQLDKNKLVQLGEELEKHNACQQHEELILRQAEIRQLKVCPTCAGECEFTPQDKGSYQTMCLTCHSKRFLDTQNNTSFELRDRAELTFSSIGRWNALN